MFERKVVLYPPILTGVIAGLVLWGCSAKQATEAEPEPVVTVDVAPVLSSAIQLKVNGDALLYPLQQAAIVPKLSAPVTKFYVEKGSHVRAGQLLAELENKDLLGAVAENKAAYEQAEASYETTARATVPEEVQKAELDLKAAKGTMDAQQKLYESRQALYREGAIAQKDVNDAQVTLTQAQNQYEIARTHLERRFLHVDQRPPQPGISVREKRRHRDFHELGIAVKFIAIGESKLHRFGNDMDVVG